MLLKNHAYECQGTVPYFEPSHATNHRNKKHGSDPNSYRKANSACMWDDVLPSYYSHYNHSLLHNFPLEQYQTHYAYECHNTDPLDFKPSHVACHRNKKHKSNEIVANDNRIVPQLLINFASALCE